MVWIGVLVGLMLAQASAKLGEPDARRWPVTSTDSRRLLTEQDVTEFMNIDWDRISYGGDYGFVGKEYRGCVVVEHALSWTEAFVLDFLDWELLIFQSNGNFRRPGETEDIFPYLGNIELKWKYDDEKDVIKIDFYLSPLDSQLATWRFDFLKVSEDLSHLDGVGCASETCSDPDDRFTWEMRIADDVYETTCAWRWWNVPECKEGYEEDWEWSFCGWKRVCSKIEACDDDDSN